MTEISADTSRSGSAADRKTKTSTVTAAGGTVSLIIGLSDWVLLQCYGGGVWHWVPPSQTLIEMAAPIILLPVALWFSNVAQILGDIITDKLQKDDSK